MAKVKVLIEGYTSGETGGHSCSTVYLVKDGNLKIIVDPGTLPSQNLLIKKLKKESLKPENIDVWSKCDGNISKSIKLIKSPGHSDDSITLLVKTKKGVIAICGDVFWQEDFPKKDSLANDLKKLKKSRKKVLKLADYLIPGHGKMFKNPRRENESYQI